MVSRQWTAGFTLRAVSAYLSRGRRADSNRLPLLTTGDNQDFAGVCKALQTPYANGFLFPG